MFSAIAPATLPLKEETQRAHIFQLVVFATVPIALACVILVAVNYPEKTPKLQRPPSSSLPWVLPYSDSIEGGRAWRPWCSLLA